MKADRRLLTLAAAVLIAAAAWWIGSGPDAATPARQVAPGAAAGGAASSIDDVQLETLRAESPAPGATERNLFRFGERPAAAVASTPMAAPPPVAPTGPPVEAGPVPPPPLPPIPFRFIGLVERPGPVRIAVLTDGRIVVHGREGDIIEGRYRILRIGAEAVDMAYTDGQGRQSIRLTGQ
jgi:hypothetical protein